MNENDKIVEVDDEVSMAARSLHQRFCGVGGCRDEQHASALAQDIQRIIEARYGEAESE